MKKNILFIVISAVLLLYKPAIALEPTQAIDDIMITETDEEGDIVEEEVAETPAEKMMYIEEKTGYACVIVEISEGKYLCYGENEMTQAIWQKVTKSNPSHFRSSPNNPVENVSKVDVDNFIKKFNKLTGKNYRLPTYEEWLFVASYDINYIKTATDDKQICEAFNLYDKTSDKLNRFGNKPYDCEDNFAYTAPVDSFDTYNDYGIYNLIGNVAEWSKTPANMKNQFITLGYSFADSKINLDKYDGRNFDSKFGGLGFRLVLDIESIDFAE